MQIFLRLLFFSIVGVGPAGYPGGERYRLPQEVAPYSSNYPLEQSAEMYGASINAALSQQPCHAPWFANDPSLPVLPINSCWLPPQPVNPQPQLRLTQPFRHFNQRNVPNYYFSPLKSFHAPNQSMFLNQPQLDPLYLPPQDIQSYQPRGLVQTHPHREAQSYQHRDTPVYQPREQAFQHRDVQSYQPRDLQAHHLREMQAYQSSETFDRALPVQETTHTANQEVVIPPNQAPNQVAQDAPDFQGRGDQLSLSMIYNYLTSSDQVLKI